MKDSKGKPITEQVKDGTMTCHSCNEKTCWTNAVTKDNAEKLQWQNYK